MSLIINGYSVKAEIYYLVDKLAPLVDFIIESENSQELVIEISGFSREEIVRELFANNWQFNIRDYNKLIGRIAIKYPEFITFIPASPKDLHMVPAKFVRNNRDILVNEGMIPE